MRKSTESCEHNPGWELPAVSTLKIRLLQTNFQGILGHVLECQRELQTLRRLLRTHRVVGIVGARQVGKTTLARSLLSTRTQPSTFFDLEDPRDLARLDDPMLALKDLKGLVVIDKIRRYPDLFSVLRVLVDRPRAKNGPHHHG
ncbi:AAA family ATPase [Acidobacteria bacterium AH-259-D05]|nr:AAA family ATPase [Acidobacteria bacterium AH-259-D05]